MSKYLSATVWAAVRPSVAGRKPASPFQQQGVRDSRREKQVFYILAAGTEGLIAEILLAAVAVSWIENLS